MSSPASVTARTPRKFLVVIDKTRESAVALRFATRRAQHTGGRALLHDAAKVVNELSGIIPELVILYGATTECLVQLLKDDKDISILVLASGIAKEGPGPLVAMFGAAVQAIPVTIVPGNFTNEQIDALA